MIDISSRKTRTEPIRVTGERPMHLDALLFHLTDALGALGTILTAAATVACHVVVFAIMKTTFGGPHRWYDTVVDWTDAYEGLTWSLFPVASVGLGIGIALASARYDLPTEMMLGLCLVVPIIGTWMGLLARFSKA